MRTARTRHASKRAPVSAVAHTHDRSAGSAGDHREQQVAELVVVLR